MTFAELFRQLVRWLESLLPGPPIGGLVIFHDRRRHTVGEITVRDDETTLRASITLVDAEGSQVEPDSPPTWEVGDDTVLSVTPSQDGKTATFVVGSPGASAVTVTAIETHDGEGDPTPIVLTGLVTVLGGDAVGGSVEFTVG